MPHPLIQRALALLQPDTTEPPPAVRFVPVPLLFVHAEPLPEGIQPGELQNFADVTMEGLAPMPLEQLSWGFLIHERSPSLLLFAAARDRLTQEELAPEDSFFHVLPSFFAAAPADGAAAWVFLWEAGHVAALRYEAETPVPSRVEIEPLIEDSPAGAFAARDRLLKRLGPSARTEASPSLLASPHAVRGPRERLLFSFTSYSALDVEPTRVDGHPPASPASLWSADLRDNLFRTTEQQRRRTLLLINRAMLSAGVTAALLLLLQVVWAAGAIWVSVTEKHVDKQKNLVAGIEQNQTLLTKIDQFTAHQLRPFEMMAVINDLRPPPVIYKTAKAANSNELIAQCIAPDVTTMNEFTDALNKSGLMDATNANGVLGPRGVTFNLDVKFRNPLLPEPMPADKPPEPPPVVAQQGALNLNRPNFPGSEPPGEPAQAEGGQPGEGGGPPPGGFPQNEQPGGPPGPAVYINNSN